MKTAAKTSFALVYFEKNIIKLEDFDPTRDWWASGVSPLFPSSRPHGHNGEPPLETTTWGDTTGGKQREREKCHVYIV